MIKITEDMRSDNKLTAALAYAEAGWRIHLLQKNSKKPLMKDWPSIATSDPKTIKNWLKDNPDANIGGIPPKNVFVLDCDGEEGKESYKKLKIESDSAYAITPNGKHRYVEGQISKSKIGFQNGLDLIGDDGSRYLVLPPSRYNRKSYKWGKNKRIKPLDGKHLRRIEEILANDKKIGQSPITIKEGSRNNDLFKIARSLHRNRLVSPFAFDLLSFVNQRIEKPLSQGEVTKIYESSLKYDVNQDDAFGDMSTVKKEDIDWFWYPYIARGCMTILEGPPGKGKSFLTMYLAAITSAGGTFPFGNEKIEAGRVLILNAEDDAASVLRPRLEACGADLSKDNIRFQKIFVPMNEMGIELLDTEIKAYRPDLVIIDPLLTYMEGDMHRYNDATMFMADIDQLAKDYRCCIIGVRHLTKSNNDDASKRGLGSVGFTARARSVIQVGEAPDDKSQLAMGHAKTNWGEFGRTLVLALEGGGKDAMPKLVWKREADYGVDDINKSNDVGRPSDQPELQLFLKSTLSMNGPMNINDLMVAAVEVGLDCSLRSVQRALGKVATIDGKGPIAKWVLKE